LFFYLYSDETAGGKNQLQVQGSRFSKSASERMTMLEQRKKTMLEQARRFVLKLSDSYLVAKGDNNN
jgi:hypothetical protein